MSEKAVGRIYWLSTAFFTLLMFFSAIQELRRAPELVEAVEFLGFPTYVLSMLGVAKLLGIPVLLIPRWPHLTEWAYAGFAFDLGAGFIAHLITGDTLELLHAVALRRAERARLRWRPVRLALLTLRVKHLDNLLGVAPEHGRR